ncbi:MAG: U32 family peptidase [Proteobacteria bacterium]|nr:U32 family peptidase [Pseudomonadota bacterium]
MAGCVQLTLGPLLFHWPIEAKRDFYARIADEAPVDVVYLGEVVCSKRAPFSEPHYPEIAERLARAGKRVVFCSLAEVMLRRERQMTAELCALTDYEVEINDASGLAAIGGRPHRIGQFFNVYNEETLRHLVHNGATHFTLPAELPRDSVAILADAARACGVTLEVQAFGRTPLALSARCYHARAHGRVKDNCQFVCEEDPDGMVLSTLEGRDWLVINGVQTLSYPYLCLLDRIHGLQRIGVTHLRLLPHALDMIAVARLFRGVADGILEPAEAQTRLLASGAIPALTNGFCQS